MDSLFFDYPLSRISHCLKQEPQPLEHLCDTQLNFRLYFDLSLSRIYPYLKQIFWSLQALQRKGRQESHGPPLFLKSYFARDVFLEIRFCVVPQSIQNFFRPCTPRISPGAPAPADFSLSILSFFILGQFLISNVTFNVNSKFND